MCKRYVVAAIAVCLVMGCRNSSSGEESAPAKAKPEAPSSAAPPPGRAEAPETVQPVVTLEPEVTPEPGSGQAAGKPVRSCEQLETQMAEVAAAASSCQMDADCEKHAMFAYESCNVFISKTHERYTEFHQLLKERTQLPPEACGHVRRKCRKVAPGCTDGACGIRRSK